MNTTADTTERVILLDRINCLLTFDQTGKDCEEGMALMGWHGITADELNARRASPERPIYRPVR
jgi:hypothetical protein